MNKSRIQWTDYAWSPVTGCSKVSQGCKNCYAEARHKRFKGGDFSVKLHPDRLNEPLHRLKGMEGFMSKHGRRPRVFVCPMADLFHDDVPFEFIQRVFYAMGNSPFIDFQVLTKRPERMREILSIFPGEPSPNIWIGVTAENQEEADRRIPILLKTPAAIRWVSIEPMIGRIDIQRYTPTDRFYMTSCECGWIGSSHLCGAGIDGDDIVCPSCYASMSGDDASVIDWVVCGGESGHSARYTYTEWVRQLRDRCHKARVPFFFKQWGPEGGITDDSGMPILDGRVHNSFPEAQG